MELKIKRWRYSQADTDTIQNHLISTNFQWAAPEATSLKNTHTLEIPAMVHWLKITVLPQNRELELLVLLRVIRFSQHEPRRASGSAVVHWLSAADNWGPKFSPARTKRVSGKKLQMRWVKEVKTKLRMPRLWRSRQPLVLDSRCFFNSSSSRSHKSVRVIFLDNVVGRNI